MILINTTVFVLEWKLYIPYIIYTSYFKTFAHFQLDAKTKAELS